MSHIICPQCKGLKSVLDPEGNRFPCGQCSAIGVVHQKTGRCEGYVAPAAPDEPEDEPVPVGSDTGAAPMEDNVGQTGPCSPTGINGPSGYLDEVASAIENRELLPLEPPAVPVGTEPVGDNPPPTE